MPGHWHWWSLVTAMLRFDARCLLCLLQVALPENLLQRDLQRRLSCTVLTSLPSPCLCHDRAGFQKMSGWCQPALRWREGVRMSWLGSACRSWMAFRWEFSVRIMKKNQNTCVLLRGLQGLQEWQVMDLGWGAALEVWMELGPPQPSWDGTSSRGQQVDGAADPELPWVWAKPAPLSSHQWLQNGSRSQSPQGRCEEQGWSMPEDRLPELLLELGWRLGARSCMHTAALHPTPSLGREILLENCLHFYNKKCWGFFTQR